MRFINLALILFMLFVEVSMADQSQVPTVGLFPRTFPRDPVEVNIYLEHMLLGQILEPLVESGADGSILPAVASSWEISKDSKEITFFIQKDLKFSNGAPVTAQDVKYTLERHLNSTNSQSKAYLKRIKRLVVKSSSEITLILDSPYIAIFKALSRDHLGIVPANWQFDSQSHEPFVGTGPYRAIKEGMDWYLKTNSYYRERSNIRIASWRILFSPEKQDPSTKPLVPDLLPFADEQTVKSITKNAAVDAKNLVIEPITHFSQSSAWWFPRGKSYSDDTRRTLGMQAMRALIKRRIDKKQLHPATGVIPEGISGHLATQPEPAPLAAALKPSNRNYTIAVLSREYATLYDPEDISAVEKQFGVHLDMYSYDASQSELSLKRVPDIVMFAFAGGFQDPEGFLTIVTSMLGEQLNVILRDHYADYLAASAETDWSERSGKYQAVNKFLVQSLRMAPGWKLVVCRMQNAKLLSERDSLRYSPKLKDYRLRKEDE